ncbi:holin [Gordonia phage GordDuk1]|uniref:Holin n=1 Tax=Gordonia phage GordDuk1 TaxID=1622191 RepID=A0A0E3T824_9CAUD|nr:holin [Gordonia phage GordDuk1]AKC02955.1 holin [Gordonia phage GordDuk1]
MTTNTPDTRGPVNIFNIRSFNDLIAMLYVIIPFAQAALVGYGVADQNQALVIAGFAGALLQLVLTFARTQEFARKAIYTVLLGVNAVLVIYRVIDPEFLNQWLPLINILLIGAPAAVAVQNVNTSGDEIYSRAGAGSYRYDPDKGITG